MVASVGSSSNSCSTPEITCNAHHVTWASLPLLNIFDVISLSTDNIGYKIMHLFTCSWREVLLFIRCCNSASWRIFNSSSSLDTSSATSFFFFLQLLAFFFNFWMEAAMGMHDNISWIMGSTIKIHGLKTIMVMWHNCEPKRNWDWMV